MSTYKKKPDFFTSLEGIEALEELKAIVSDVRYNTVSSYSANTELHPDHLISFTEKHMIYLRDHPELNPKQYISNLRLITKIR